MAKAHHITHWDVDYENAETRKYANLNWYPKKTKLIGEGIGYTLAQENATHLLGMWYLIEALAATAPKGQRGWLIRNGTPLTAQRMFSLTRIDAKHFDEALKFFSQPQIGWLEFIEMPGGSPGKTPVLTETPDATGRLPVEPPGSLPPKTETPDATGRKSLDETKKTDGRTIRRDEEPAGGSSAVVIPTEEEVRAWAKAHGVDETYAVERFHVATEKKVWVANGKLIDWRSRFQRFWKKDRETFLQKKSARPAASGDRPNGWKKGDDDLWWSDPIASVEAALSGALMGGAKKTAARLKVILKIRRAKP